MLLSAMGPQLVDVNLFLSLLIEKADSKTRREKEKKS